MFARRTPPFFPIWAIYSAWLLIPPVYAVSTPTPSTADHSKFEELQQTFNTGPEVTRACLGCHTEAGKELHKTTHWTWAFENQLTGR